MVRFLGFDGADLFTDLHEHGILGCGETKERLDCCKALVPGLWKIPPLVFQMIKKCQYEFFVEIGNRELVDFHCT